MYKLPGTGLPMHQNHVHIRKKKKKRKAGRYVNICRALSTDT